MMRAWMAAAVVVMIGGCASLPGNGEQMCNPDPKRECPDGYHCEVGRCYKNGFSPDLGGGVPGDGDMSGGDMSGGGGGDGDMAGVGPDMAVVCGATGQACCAGPLAPCNNGGTVCSSNVCVANDLWIAGYAFLSTVDYHASAVHFDGSAWGAIDFFASSSHGGAIWGYAPDRYFVVDDEGNIVQRFGGSWTICSSTNACKPTHEPAGTNLSAIFGVSSNDIWLGGTSSVLRHYESSDWVVRKDGLPSSFDVQRITGSASDDVWFTGFAGTGHWNGSSWTFDNTITGRDIWSAGRNDVWAVGDNFIRHWNGTAWSSSYAVDGAGLTKPVYSVGGSGASDAWVGAGKASGGYLLAHWDGAAWTSVALPVGSSGGLPWQIWAASKTQAYVVSESELWQWDGALWTLGPPPPSGSWIRIWGSANAGR